MDSNTLATLAGCQIENPPSDRVTGRVKTLASMGFCDGLGCRDSNPNYLLQRQASYR